MLKMYRSGISAVTLAAATDAGGGKPKAPRKSRAAKNDEKAPDDVAKTEAGAAKVDDVLDTENPAQGNRHSHPAETEAERTVRLAAGGTEEAAASNGESSQTEDGSVQDATRQAIGAGNGAPDGVAGPGADPSEAEVNQVKDDQEEASGETITLDNGTTFSGGKVKLWHALEKGATHADMLKATGYRSALGTMQVMLQYAGREVDVTKNEAGERFYKLKPVASKAKAD